MGQIHAFVKLMPKGSEDHYKLYLSQLLLVGVEDRPLTVHTDMVLTVHTDMVLVARAMSRPDSGLEIRDRLWLKITIPRAFIGQLSCLVSVAYRAVWQAR